MRGVSAILRHGPSASALTFAPSAAAPAATTASVHWRFASDLRAALQLALMAADAIAVVAAGVAGCLICSGRFDPPLQYWGQIVIAGVIFILGMQNAGMYRFATLRRGHEQILAATGMWAMAILLISATIYFPQLDEYTRAWMLLWALVGWCALLATRALASQAVRHFHRQLATCVAVVGDPLSAQRCAQRLRADGDVEIVDVVELPDRPGHRDWADNGVFARLRATDTRIDEIVFAVSGGEILDLDAALGRFHPRLVDVKLGLDVAASGDRGALAMLPVWRRPLAGLPTVLKRLVDIAASTLLLAFVAPLMVVIAALVKLDSPGPALFRQQRFGINKEPFRLYKFRSMHCRAGDDPTAPQARRHDPRVTRIGRFLRRTSLDELPQLFNVLKGEMSLVGPRPHPTALDEKFAPLIADYAARHNVKPGLTGWAQVQGWRGETDTFEKMRRRIEHDLYYIDHWSLRLDLTILLRTLVVVFGHQNAY
jgi:Undecaprenyl-phosphate glucose phosphotransferase